MVKGTVRTMLMVQ